VARHEEGEELCAQRPERLTRRTFMRGAGGVTAGGLLAAEAGPERPSSDGEALPPQVHSLRGRTRMELSVNRGRVEVSVEPRATLLDALRSHAEPALTGTKSVCERGNCGACTVLIDDEPACSCLVLAADAVGREVRTVEGLADGREELSALQESFCEHDALMCGFCTPGFLMSITSLLERDPGADLDAVKGACSGNVCRCGTYPHIFAAALAAGERMQGDER